jgi:hypothetical protein
MLRLDGLLENHRTDLREAREKAGLRPFDESRA